MSQSQNIFNNFQFSSCRSPINKEKIVALDIDGIIAKRDLKALTSNFDVIINIDAKELKESGLDDIFIKLFRLSQLGIDFLLHCKSFLQQSLDHTEAQLDQLKKELSDHKCLSKPSKMQQCDIKSRLVLAAQVDNANFKCRFCHKIFISNGHLNRHEVRRHLNKKNADLPTALEVENTLSRKKIPNILKPQKLVNEINKVCSLKQEKIFENAPLSNLEDIKEADDVDLPKPVSVFEDLSSNIEYTDFAESQEQLKNSTPLSTSPLKSNELSKDCDIHISGIELLSFKDKSHKIVQKLKEQDLLIESPPKNEILVPHTEGQKEQSPTALEKENFDSVIDHNCADDKHLDNSLKKKDESITDHSEDCGEVISDTSSHTTESDEYLSSEKLRKEIEKQLDNKLKALGIDPKWKKIPDAVAKNNASLLGLQREKIVKKYKNYHQVRSKIITEVKGKLQEISTRASQKTDTKTILMDNG